MQKYAKGIVAVVGAVLIATSEIYGGQLIWLPIALAFVTAFGVYMVPNIPE